MKPHQLIGKGYRLGADFERHDMGDCLSLARTVLAHYGIDAPRAKRDWYRRLRRGDWNVFPEELNRWGVKVEQPRLGSVALCQAGEGYGLAVFYEEGWLSYGESAVRWCPIDALQVLDVYCQRKQSFAMPSV